jgi:SAM-dependent methyltransferase
LVFSYSAEIIAAAEEMAGIRSIDDVLESLRQLCLDDFAELLCQLPSPRFPHLSSVLPRMASEKVQNNWTGNSGLALLGQTVSFVRLVAGNCQKLLGHGLNNRAMLDFGCGYGRLIRLMYYYTSPARIWGIDPWQEAIELCRADGVLGQLAVSEYLPSTIPVGNARFDLIYSFSVLTHLSERAAILALTTLRQYVASGGLFVLTIRPKEYWSKLDGVAAVGRPIDSDELVAQHEKRGFAFVPHDREAIDGEVTYGETSLSFEWIKEHAKGWDMAGYDRSLVDPLQIHVYLVPN